MEGKLRRDLSALHGYAMLIGGMIGSGIFVVTGEAGAVAGPSVPLGYVVLLPVLLSSALAYLIYLSTPLGQKAGGAYVHISRTFGNHFVGFIFMWFQYLAMLGVMAIVALSFGQYLMSLVPIGSPLIFAAALIICFYILNLFGVKWFGIIQVVMMLFLLLAVVLLVVPGLFHVRMELYRPFLPFGWEGFLSALPSLFFAYFGFEQLAQAGGEMKDPQRSLPRTMFRGSVITVLVYFLISFVAFGILPYAQLAKSQSAMADVAAVYLPSFAKGLVALGIIAAFATTLNSLVMVLSRILFSFAEDRIIAPVLASVNRRFGTPHVALTINMLLVIGLIATNTMGYLLTISLQGMFILYMAHAISMMALPYIRPKLFETALYKPSKGLMLAVGAFAVLVLAYFSYMMIFSVLKLLAIWTVVGIVIYLIGRFMGRTEGFDYRKNLLDAWSSSSV